MREPPRDLVVVEVTVTGDDPRVHRVIDVSAVSVYSGATMDIALPVSAAAIDRADRAALSRAGYTAHDLRERAAVMESAVVAEQLRDLSAMLQDGTLAGSSPQRTASFLYRLLASAGLGAQWHHQIAELGPMTAGAKGLSPTEIPSLSACARLWGVSSMMDLFTAAGTAGVVAQCFTRMVESFRAAGAELPMSCSIADGGLRGVNRERGGR